MSVAGCGRWLPPAAFAAAGLIAAGCNEHPREYPTARPAGREYPAEHRARAAAAGITKDSLADAIEAWVGKQGGTLDVKDDKTGETLSFSLVKVHRERIAHLSKDTCFVCADFKTAAGKIYDLDVFVTGTALDNLKFHDLTIHKEEGKPRYTWYEEGGVWKKKSMAAAGSGSKGEQPMKMPTRAAGSGSRRQQPKKASEHPVEHPK